MIKIASRIIYISVFGVLFMRCSEDVLPRKVEDIKESNKIATRSSGDNGLDLLGYGYDSKMAFADPSAALAKVIDVEKLQRDFPNRIEVGRIDKQDVDYASGSNYHSYVKEIAAKHSSSATFFKKLFTASLNWAFKYSDFHSEQYSYASYDLKVQRKRLSIFADNEDLAGKYITDIFREDYLRLSPEALVKRYGDFVLRDIVLGGKLSIAYRSHISIQSKKRVVEAGMALGMKKIFNFSINGSYSTADSTANKQGLLVYRTQGGDASKELTSTVYMDKSTVPVNIKPWQNSVSLKNAQLIDIGNDGLIPLYNLVEEYDKRYELMLYQTEDLEATERELLKYEFPLHKLPKEVPNLHVVKESKDKISVYLFPTNTTKPSAAIEFNLEHMKLNADGSFFANNLKDALLANASGHIYKEDVTKVKGKLLKIGDKYSISFSLSRAKKYSKDISFHADNVDLEPFVVKSFMLTGAYSGSVSSLKLGEHYLKTKERVSANIKGFNNGMLRLSTSPVFLNADYLQGRIITDVFYVKLGTNGSFRMDEQHDSSLLKKKLTIASWFGKPKYDLMVFEGKFIPVNGGYRLRLTMKSDITMYGTHVNLFMTYDLEKNR